MAILDSQLLFNIARAHIHHSLRHIPSLGNRTKASEEFYGFNDENDATAHGATLFYESNLASYYLNYVNISGDRYKSSACLCIWCFTKEIHR